MIYEYVDSIYELNYAVAILMMTPTLSPLPAATVCQQNFPFTNYFVI
jgi:hypothetical protein